MSRKPGKEEMSRVWLMEWMVLCRSNVNHADKSRFLEFGCDVGGREDGSACTYSSRKISLPAYRKAWVKVEVEISATTPTRIGLSDWR